MSMIEEARAWQQLGYTPLPIRSDGTKAPWVDDWRTFIAEPMTAAEVEAIFGRRARAEGIGLVCGSASGGLEMLELEGRAVVDGIEQEVANLLNDNGFGDLWATINAGYVERTPSGGIHWYFRVDGQAKPNLKIARRPDDNGRPEVLIETRGEGGFTVVAPSAGATHASGRAWEILRGTRDTIPTISVGDRDALYAVLAILDTMPAVEEQQHTGSNAASANLLGEVRPGDDFNARATWAQILEPRGWARVHSFKGNHFGWRRPGKDEGISATTGANDSDNLYVFSTSTEFEIEKAYSKFAAYTLLEHGGDYTLAAKTLREAGYGKPAQATVAAPEPARLPELSQGGIVQLDEGEKPRTYSRTDDGNALRFVDAYADRVRFIAGSSARGERGDWLEWDGCKWALDEGNVVQERARDIARALPSSASADLTHKKRSLGKGAISAMLGLASSDQRIVVKRSDLDAEPYELNTPGGVVDLRTGTLHAPDPTKMHTRSTTVTPKAGPAPRWHKFLADTFAGDPEMTTYMQRLLGVSLIGKTVEQVLPFAYGSGANGKTTLLGVVMRLVGIGPSGYSISSPAEMLLDTKYERHPAEIAQLSGPRIAVTPELEEGQRFAEAKVKQLTGSDAISARFMGQNWFTYRPTATIWLLANTQPAIKTGGPAFTRRLRLLPFVHTVPEPERDPHLEDRLVAEEGAAILAWLIEGAVEYEQHGLGVPDSVAQATQAYASEQDIVQRFIDDRCDLGEPGAQTYAVASGALFAAFESWARAQGEESQLSQRALTMRLGGRFGVKSRHTRSGAMLDGIRLRPEPDEAPEPAPESSDRDLWGER